MYRSPVRRACTSLWSEERVLLTGASGFIGGAVCRALCTLGAEVHGTGCTRPTPAGIHAHRASLPEDARALVRDVAPTCILHLAAPVDMSHDEDTLIRLRAGIVHGTQAIAEEAARLGVHLVHVSSCAVYEGSRAPFSETDPLRPQSPYGRLKLEAEEEVAALSRGGLQATVLRPFRAYGPGCTSGLVAEACHAATSGCELELTDGSQVREWNHVDSIAAGIIWAAQSRPAGDVLNLGGGDRISVGLLARRIFRLARVPEERIVQGARPRRPNEVDRFWGDHRRAESLWGPLPHRDLDAGLQQTLDWHSARLRAAQ